MTDVVVQLEAVLAAMKDAKNRIAAGVSEEEERSLMDAMHLEFDAFYEAMKDLPAPQYIMDILDQYWVSTTSEEEI